MAFSVNEIQKAPEGGGYLCDRYIGLTADGELCEVGDVDCVMQIGVPGYTIPTDEARAYGLLTESPKKAKESPSARQGLNSSSEAADAPQNANPSASDDDAEGDSDETGDDDEEEAEEEPTAVRVPRAQRRASNRRK